MLRKIMHPGRAALLCTSLMITGCSDPSPENKPAPQAVHSPQPDSAPRVDKPLALTDQLALQAAANACRNDDPGAFFDAFVQSAVVRKRYTGRTVDLVTGKPGAQRREQLAGARYDGFPIQMVDFSRKPVAPAREGDDDEYIEIQLNQSQINRISVEWSRVHYGAPDEGEEREAPFTLDGKPYDPSALPDGELIFRPTAECWELAYDGRYEDRTVK